MGHLPVEVGVSDSLFCSLDPVLLRGCLVQTWREGCVPSLTVTCYSDAWLISLGGLLKENRIVQKQWDLQDYTKVGLSEGAERSAGRESCGWKAMYEKRLKRKKEKT